MPASIALYCLKVRAEALPGLRYVFKAADREVRLLDVDLQIPYDLDYPVGGDAAEVTSRLLHWREAVLAQKRIRRVLLQHLDCPLAEVDVDLVAVNPRDPLAKFAAETSLLRLLPYWSQEGEPLSDFSFAWSSSRADGIRADGNRLLYRRSIQPAQMCFEVTARRNTPGHEADVIVRYGAWRRNIEEPRERVERFGFVEWEYPSFDKETEMALVDASRALTEDQASAIANSLRENADFCDVCISSKPFFAFAADEGLLPTGDVVFAQASAEEEALLGFPHFLSVWLDEG